MKKRIFLLILLFLIFSPNLVNAADLEYVACGNAEGIPAAVPQLISIVYTLLIVATPIILIIFSIVALLKALTGGSADDINKAKNKLIKKFIAAALVFFVAGIGKFVIMKAADASEKDSVSACLECMLYNSGCQPSTGGDDAYKATTRPGESVPQEPGSTQPSGNSNPVKADSTIFVGDSRTVGMCQYGDAQLHVGQCRDYLTVCQGGMGYNWFKGTGLTSLNNLLRQNPDTVYNIVILLGVNDISNTKNYADAAVSEYISIIETQAKSNWKNHNVIFASVTKLGGAQTGGSWPVSQSNINYFNGQMRSKIASLGLSNVSYCDIDSGLNLDGKIASDLIHYTSEGYTAMYNQVVNKCLK